MSQASGSRVIVKTTKNFCAIEDSTTMEEFNIQRSGIRLFLPMDNFDLEKFLTQVFNAKRSNSGGTPHYVISHRTDQQITGLMTMLDENFVGLLPMSGAVSPKKQHDLPRRKKGDTKLSQMAGYLDLSSFWPQAFYLDPTSKSDGLILVQRPNAGDDFLCAIVKRTFKGIVWKRYFAFPQKEFPKMVQFLIAHGSDLNHLIETHGEYKGKAEKAPA